MRTSRNRNNRFKNNLYTIEDIKHIDDYYQYVINDDGIKIEVNE